MRVKDIEPLIKSIVENETFANSLKRLIIPGIRVGDYGFKLIAKMLSTPECSLTHIDFSWNHWSR